MSSSKTVPAQEDVTEYSHLTRNDFPHDFVFGTATSAYQHEGGAMKGGRGTSIWDDFTLRTPRRISDRSNGNVAVDMYTKYKEDIKFMKAMGFDAYRFSISWPRILPAGKVCLGVNQEGIDFYNDIINTLLANDIQPYVTLFHWDLPNALEQEYGGFLSKNIVNDFREYAQLCFWEFGDRVKHWITLNEPWTYSVHGYASFIFPPGNKDLTIAKASASASASAVAFRSVSDGIDGINLSEARGKSMSSSNVLKKPGNNFLTYRGAKPETIFNNLIALNDISSTNISTKENITTHDDERCCHKPPLSSASAKNVYIVARNMLLAHSAAVESYRTNFKEQQKGKIGITLVSHWFEPLNENKDDKEAAERARDFMLGWFLEPVLTGGYPKNMKDFVPCGNLAPFSVEESNLLKKSIDFLGLNYYTTNYVAYDCNPDSKQGYFHDQKARFTTEKNGMPIGPVAGSPWLYIVPWGIYKLLTNYIDRKYKTIPEIYITENGVDEKNDPTLTAREACADKMRINYHRDHLGNILKAMNNQGINVKGYFAWSWSDNFEWVEGYTVRFGLIYVDYMNYLKRYPKDSAIWFSKFLVKKKLPPPMKGVPNIRG